MIETATFTCSICREPSSTICAYCTKDACGNHRCERCNRCSDCCECEVPLTAPQPEMAEPPKPEPAMLESALFESAAPEPVVPAEPVPALVEPSLSEPDNAWLAPPEATEEPDLNMLPSAIIEEPVEQEPPEEKARPFPTNSAHGGSEGAE